jgi:hypothetical protein
MTRIRIILAIVALVAIVAGVVWIRRDGETAGAAKVTAKANVAHAAGVTEARADERAAAAVTQSIAERTVRIDAKTDAYVQATIEDLHNALADVPPAAPGAALPAAPVDRVRDSLNAGIARANRAGGDAGAASGVGED